LERCKHNIKHITDRKLLGQGAAIRSDDYVSTTGALMEFQTNLKSGMISQKMNAEKLHSFFLESYSFNVKSTTNKARMK